MFGRFLVHVWRSCGGLNKEHSISVHWGSNSFWHATRCQNEYDPQWTDIECSLFKPPHDLQHIHHDYTKHGRFCKQNNQLPFKSHDELKDNSIIPNDIGIGPVIEEVVASPQRVEALDDFFLVVGGLLRTLEGFGPSNMTSIIFQEGPYQLVQFAFLWSHEDEELYGTWT